MKNTILIFLFIATTVANAADFGEIEGFSIKKVQTYDAPSGKKLAKIARELISTPIKITNISSNKKYYQISLDGSSVWVKKRHVISSNIKINCLTLTSNMNRHIAGSKALTSEKCS